MRFAEAGWLVAVAIVVPLAAGGIVWGEWVRRRTIARFGVESVLAMSSVWPTRGRRVLVSVLSVLGIAFGLVALARPQLGTAADARRRAAGDVVFLLDVSRSMNATDVAPSRLGAAKQAAAAIARALPNDRVGLVVLGGTGFLQLPPTLDHSTFRTFLDVAGTADVPDPSTNFEAAASVAAATVGRAADVPYSALVLLSDGEDTEGKLEGAIRVLRDTHVPTSAVGVGTSEGATIPDRDASGTVTPHRNYLGQPVISHLIETNLRDIARRTGGVYVRWAGDASVQPVVAELLRLRTRAVSGPTRSPEAERYQWPLGAAFVMLGAASLVRALRPRHAGWRRAA